MKLQEAESDIKQVDMLKHDKLQLTAMKRDILLKNHTAIKSIPQHTWEEAFSAPIPQRKKEFLEYLQKENVYREDIQSHKKQVANTAKAPIGIGSCILSQITYIRKWVYLASLLILALAVIAADYAGTNSVWVVAAIMPFIALCMVTESTRSETYGMAELEMASRFSIRSIMLARFATIGAVHMISLCILIPVVGHSALISFLQAGIYLLVPYLAASVLEFAAIRRLRGKEGLSVCMVVSVMVSVLNTMLKGLLTYLFGAGQFVIWLILAVYLTGRAIREYRIMIYQTQEWMV